MAENDEVLAVKIKKNGKECAPDKHFRAKPGSTVTFTFEGVTDAIIVFENGSPFSGTEFAPSAQRVRQDAVPGDKFKYRVNWGSGNSGNGTGEVITG